MRQFIGIFAIAVLFNSSISCAQEAQQHQPSSEEMKRSWTQRLEPWCR